MYEFITKGHNRLYLDQSSKLSERVNYLVEKNNFVQDLKERIPVRNVIKMAAQRLCSVLERRC